MVRVRHIWYSHTRAKQWLETETALWPHFCDYCSAAHCHCLWNNCFDIVSCCLQNNFGVSRCSKTAIRWNQFPLSVACLWSNGVKLLINSILQSICDNKLITDKSVKTASCCLLMQIWESVCVYKLAIISISNYSQTLGESDCCESWITIFLETGCLSIVDLCNCLVIESDPQKLKVLHYQLLHDKLVIVTNENCMARFR